MDKQIIIDGVDVSGCLHYTGNVNYLTDKNWTCRAGIQGTKCEDWSDCYFKSWQRKEKRIVELNKTIKAKEQEYEKLKKEIINRNEKIEELRFSVSDLTNRLCDLNAEKSFRIVDLEQTLTKIKEIAEKNLNIHTCAFKGCGYDLITKQIIQICDEVNDVK